MDKLKLLSLNVRGIKDTAKRHKLFHWLHKKQVDIIVLQETHSTDSDEKQWPHEWGDKHFYMNHGTNQSAGVSILFWQNHAFAPRILYPDNCGKTLIVVITYQDKEYVIVNIYGPNEEEPVFFADLYRQLFEMDQSNVIIGGDLNMTLSPLDKLGGQSTPLSVKAEVFTSLTESEYLDTFRLLHPDKRIFTWWRWNPKPIMCRLDYFFISDSLVNSICKSTIWPSFLLDHSPIYLELNTNNFPRGPGLWKHNESHLALDEYKQLIHTTIKETLVNYSQADPHMVWDMLKMIVWAASIKFSKDKSWSECLLLQVLEKKLHLFENMMPSSMYSADEIATRVQNL